jgi:hypothetical protein
VSVILRSLLLPSQLIANLSQVYKIPDAEAEADRAKV